MDIEATLRGKLQSAKILSAALNGSDALFLSNGGELDHIFGSAGIRRMDMDSPVSEIKLSQYCHLFEIAAANTQNNNIGLAFGKTFKPKQLGMLGFSAISSPTLSAAIKNLEAYFPAHQGQTSFGVIQDNMGTDDDILWLSYRVYDPQIPLPHRRQDAELSLGVFCNIFRAALGEDWNPLEVRFEHAKPEASHDHENVFNAPVEFGRRTNAIAFRRKDLDAKMPEQDPYLFSVVSAFLEGRLKLQQDPVDFAQLLRNEIKLHLGSKLPTIQEIASVLGLSNNAFQKELRVNGLNFPDTLKAARQELALHYMDDLDIPLSEIAYRLGYSEPSAFSRAFRSWTGMSPQRYRRLD